MDPAGAVGAVGAAGAVGTVLGGLFVALERVSTMECENCASRLETPGIFFRSCKRSAEPAEKEDAEDLDDEECEWCLVVPGGRPRRPELTADPRLPLEDMTPNEELSPPRTPPTRTRDCACLALQKVSACSMISGVLSPLAASLMPL